MSEKTVQKCHTQFPWEFSQFTVGDDGEKITTKEQVAKQVAASALHPEGSGELWGVTIPGTNVVICYTGNGPHSEANAATICELANSYDPAPGLKYRLRLEKAMAVINELIRTGGAATAEVRAARRLDAEKRAAEFLDFLESETLASNRNLITEIEGA